MGKPSFIHPFTSTVYQKRRAKLIDGLSKISGGDFTALFWSGSEMVRNHTSHFLFRAHSDFLYLTGFHEPESMLILQVIKGKARAIIGVRPRDLSTNRGSELWDGERLGVERAPKTLGVDEAFDSHKVNDVLKKVLPNAHHLFWNLGVFKTWDSRIISLIKEFVENKRGIPTIEALFDSRPVLHELRKVKGPEEIEVMRHAGSISTQGHIRAMKSTRPSHFEFEVQGEMEREFRKLGAIHNAYNFIIAGGNNACVLHYNANNSQLKAGDLILIDAAAEFEGYASDITRTFPVSGRFTPAQREVYSWVLKSQVAAIKSIRAGIPFSKVHETATKVLCEGLSKMKIIKASPQSIFKKMLYRPFFPHGTSHWIGHDVHDTGVYVSGSDTPKSVKLVAGNVLTVEPGLYFRSDDRRVPAKYRGIGIRIEDDVLVTRNGSDVLTKHCPKSIEEIETICGPKL